MPNQIARIGHIFTKLTHFDRMKFDLELRNLFRVRNAVILLSLQCIFFSSWLMHELLELSIELLQSNA
jgi:hypothetical protein